ncbi:DUF2161 domain-containing phosphodiesterase [Paenibacillus cymbidii]|uniref:DUF2161 domain-containing phosphodiesterase n=1 Tax=Paenibacillus cymbidii TaxID=1639034 RepID=UPI0010822BD8|nr:DUF2161 family putative PD-(D/E)XK-type phosphodiesterase [Paenibacillus cymbidii]
MPIQSETELYAPVKAYFEQLGYDVRGEVKHCDVVALRGDEAPVIVELKKTLTVPLLVQAIDRLQHTDRVYVAVEQHKSGRSPRGVTWSDAQRLCRMLGLGLIVVRFYKTKPPFVEVLCDPTPYVPRKSAKRVAGLIAEFRERSGDYNVGGSTRRKLITAYREKAIRCAMLMAQHGPLSTKQLRELTHIANVTAIMQHNYYFWFRRASRGVYELTEQGRAAAAEYGSVIPPAGG